MSIITNTACVSSHRVLALWTMTTLTFSWPFSCRSRTLAWQEVGPILMLSPMRPHLAPSAPPCLLGSSRALQVLRSSTELPLAAQNCWSLEITWPGLVTSIPAASIRPPRVSPPLCSTMKASTGPTRLLCPYQWPQAAATHQQASFPPPATQ